MIINPLPNNKYSILELKLEYIRLIHNMCNSGTIKNMQTTSRKIPFKKNIEIPRAKKEWQKYLFEKKAS